jgi:hypothetical protein
VARAQVRKQARTVCIAANASRSPGHDALLSSCDAVTKCGHVDALLRTYLS